LNNGDGNNNIIFYDSENKQIGDPLPMQQFVDAIGPVANALVTTQYNGKNLKGFFDDHYKTPQIGTNAEQADKLKKSIKSKLDKKPTNNICKRTYKAQKSKTK
jgi:hypothetical protein